MITQVMDKLQIQRVDGEQPRIYQQQEAVKSLSWSK